MKSAHQVEDLGRVSSLVPFSGLCSQLYGDPLCWAEVRLVDWQAAYSWHEDLGGPALSALFLRAGTISRSPGWK